MEISSVNVLVGGKKIEVSLKEAMELYAKLHDLFGKKETVYAYSGCSCNHWRPWAGYPTITWASGSSVTTGNPTDN